MSSEMTCEKPIKSCPSYQMHLVVTRQNLVGMQACTR